jgi:hypothetical protein
MADEKTESQTESTTTEAPDGTSVSTETTETKIEKD